MHATVINLSDSIRVLPVMDGSKQSIPIGAVRDLDLPEPAIKHVQGSMMRGDQLLLVPPGTEAPKQLAPVLKLLAMFDNLSEQDQLKEYFKIIPAKDGSDTRPSPITMRRSLRDYVQQFIDRNFQVLESMMQGKPPAPVNDDEVIADVHMGNKTLGERKPITQPDDETDPAMALAKSLEREEAKPPKAEGRKIAATSRSRSKAKSPPKKKGKTTRVRLRG